MLVIVKLCNGYVGVPYTLVSILVHYEKVFSKGYSEVQKVKKKSKSVLLNLPWSHSNPVPLCLAF